MGGLSKEWTTQTGDIVNHAPWVKEVDCDGGEALVMEENSDKIIKYISQEKFWIVFSFT